MFTGIVERTARVIEARHGEPGREGLRLVVAIDADPVLPPWAAVELGESIAVDGVCLTAVAASAGEPGRAPSVAFDVVPESLAKTALGELRAGDLVNIERSLRVGDRLGGHWVTGHVDGCGRVRARRPEGDQVVFEIEASAALIAQMLPKGSITVDGISLTVVLVDRSAAWFSFAAIPHTLERTQLHRRQVGDRVHLETDALGKWVIHALEGVLASEVTGVPGDGSGVRDGDRGARERLVDLLVRTGWKAPEPR